MGEVRASSRVGPEPCMSREIKFADWSVQEKKKNKEKEID